MTEKDVFDSYHKCFLPIYADVVAVVGNKPEQIIFELEATLSHIATAHKSTEKEIIEDNFKKAQNHLYRASLDAAKILWLENRKKINKFLGSGDLSKFAINCSEKEFITKHEEAETSAKEARKYELKNVGVNPISSIEMYYQSAILYNELLELIDPEKEQSFKSASNKWKSKETIFSFIIGVSASLIATLLYRYFS